MTKEFANNLLHQVELDYDTIAKHFSNTRLAAWPEFETFESLITQYKEDCSVLDVGCGNGRLAEIVNKIKASYTGLDVSEQLLSEARTLYPEHTFVHGTMLQLPFVDSTFTIVAAVASVQHIPSINYRLQALRELYRVSQPGGSLFMTNWNLHQTILPDYFTAAKKQFGDQWETGDALVPWKNDQGDLQAMRYYHGFTETELTHLLEQAGWIDISHTVNRNIVTVAKHP